MSTKTLDRPVEVDRDLNVFKPDWSASEATKLWAASTLAELPSRIIFVDAEKQKVKVSRSHEGRMFRLAFAVVADPEVQQEFRVYLYAGASSSDLSTAQRLVRNAKAGAFNSDLWRRRDNLKNWVSRMWWEVSDKDRHTTELRPCALPGCVTEYHEYRGGEFDGMHSSVGIEAEHYEISLSNFEEPCGWRPYVSFADEIPEGPAGLKVLRDAANDFDWLQQQADKLNTQREERSAA
ncbi:hypothetical protein Leucomu_05865 [Leucobacter muris]|uniref:Uncharacterized protein n=1 Tax=Leucobacter muris TaxID=1935379 RepID=A0ABX5QEK6_9MICO|nr:hypothetical protein [Leucobacter muris]QAB17511.1 hypothetical protein Leucomu_05865 [Leucobacter muris]